VTTVGGAKVDPQWGNVTPIGLTTDDIVALRPAAPPEVGSTQYETDLAEVARLGAHDVSTTSGTLTRTSIQTEIAQFWNFPTYIPFNAVARQLSKAGRLSLADNARLFAQLNAALHNAQVAAWNASYFYFTWRPVTAITDDFGSNPDLDPIWAPLLTTPLYPEYPSASSAAGAAAATVLAGWFGNETPFTVTSDALNDEDTRAYTSLSQAATENGRSRIYGGVDFQFANAAGSALGTSLGTSALSLFAALPPVLTDAGADAAIEADAGVADAGSVADAAADGDASSAAEDAGTSAGEEDAGLDGGDAVADAGSSHHDAAAGGGGSTTGGGDGGIIKAEHGSDCSVTAAGLAQGSRASLAGSLFLALAAWFARRRRQGASGRV
jgi:hypothetical protein